MDSIRNGDRMGQTVGGMALTSDFSITDNN